MHHPIESTFYFLAQLPENLRNLSKCAMYHVGHKTAPNYFSNNSVKPRSILISFGTQVLQQMSYNTGISHFLQNGKHGTSLRFI